MATIHFWRERGKRSLPMSFYDSPATATTDRARRGAHRSGLIGHQWAVCRSLFLVPVGAAEASREKYQPDDDEEPPDDEKRGVVHFVTACHSAASWC